jgi:hypothetical protein
MREVTQVSRLKSSIREEITRDEAWIGMARNIMRENERKRKRKKSRRVRGSNSSFADARISFSVFDFPKVARMLS